jgi:hypothetical protein
MQNVSNLTWSTTCFTWRVEKILNSNFNLNVTFLTNIIASFITPGNFFEDFSVSKHHVWNSLNYLPQPPCMISRDIAKFHDLHTSFVFLKFNIIRVRIYFVFPRQDFRIFFILWVRFQIWLNNMNIIFSLVFFYYYNQLHFKFD